MNEVIEGNETTAGYFPSQGVTNVVIEGNGKGQIFIEAQVPNGNWIGVASQTGAFCMSTPDSSIMYRFRAAKVKEPVRVYMGP